MEKRAVIDEVITPSEEPKQKEAEFVPNVLGTNVTQLSKLDEEHPMRRLEDNLEKKLK